MMRRYAFVENKKGGITMSKYNKKQGFCIIRSEMQQQPFLTIWSNKNTYMGPYLTAGGQHYYVYMNTSHV
jgi:hypothetical protein